MGKIKIKNNSISKSIFFFISFLFPTLLSAQPTPTPVIAIYTVFGVINFGSEPSGVGKFLQVLLIFIYGLAGLVGVLLIILAGFQYMGARDNPKEVAAAKQRILYVVYGLFIIFLGFIILNILNPLFVFWHW